MSGASARVVAAALALGAAAPVAADGVCGDAIDQPIAVPWRDAGFDAAPGACPVADVALAVRGRALIDTPAFYGTLGGDATLAVRQRAGAHVAWGLAARAIDVTFIQNAVWTIVAPTVGPLVAHGSYGVDLRLADRPLRLAALGQLALPFTRTDVDGSTGAAQLAGLASWRAGARWRAHARVAALGWYGRAVTGTSTRAAALAAIDLGWRARRRLSLDVGVDAQLGWYRGGLDHLAVRVGAAWRLARCWRLGVAAGAPLAGVERQDAAVTLGVARDLE